MSLKKRFLKHPRTQAAAAWLIYAFIRLTYATSRKQFVIDAAAQPYMHGEANGIFVFWHGRIGQMLPICPPGRKMHVLSSRHRDGTLTTTIIGHFGQSTIRGSSNKGGRMAALEIVRTLKRGDNISITPDGPRGPHQVAAQGTASLARLSRKPVIPVAFSSTRHIRFNSWDQFLLALPFGRMVFCVGAPLLLEQEDETAQRAIEQALNAQVAKADSMTHA